MAQLRTDYKDEILDASVNTQRKYRMINNADGTVSFADETVYAEEGDTFGALDVNETNLKTNEVTDKVGAIQYIKESFAGVTEYYNKPWLAIQNLVESGKIQTDKVYIGIISTNSQFEVYGRMASALYGSFYVHSYGSNHNYHIYVVNGVWYHEELASESDINTCIQIVSWDASTGTLITKSADYKG